MTAAPILLKVYPRSRPLRVLKRFWALGEGRIILASALMAHLRKRINAQRLRLSTCKAGALPTELRPHALISINVSHQTRKNTYVTPILGPEPHSACRASAFLALRPASADSSGRRSA